MPLFKFKEQKLLFIHIPKTAGTSIEYFFLNKFNVDNKNILLTKKIFLHKEYKFESSGQHLKFNEIKAIIDVDNYEIFTVVRNPYDRFVSEMEYQLQITKFYKNNNINKKKLLEDFIKWYFGVKSLRDIIFTNNNHYDHHKNPQYELLEGCHHLDVFHYETINEDFEKKFGGKLDNKYLKTVRLHYNEYYTKETEAFIYNYYKKDFELFGYERMVVDPI